MSLKLTDANSFLKGEAKLLRSRDLGEKFECKFLKIALNNKIIF